MGRTGREQQVAIGASSGQPQKAPENTQFPRRGARPAVRKPRSFFSAVGKGKKRAQGRRCLSDTQKSRACARMHTHTHRFQFPEGSPLVGHQASIPAVKPGLRLCPPEPPANGWRVSDRFTKASQAALMSKRCYKM